MTSSTPRVITTSRPESIEIEWEDGHRSLHAAAKLRRVCPCALCVDEMTSVRTHDPETVPEDLTQSDASLVGRYAIALRFSDGHHTGIFTFRLLRELDSDQP